MPTITEVVSDSLPFRLVPAQAAETGSEDVFDRPSTSGGASRGRGERAPHRVMPKIGSSDQPQPAKAEGLAVFMKGSYANTAQLHILSVARI